MDPQRTSAVKFFIPFSNNLYHWFSSITVVDVDLYFVGNAVIISFRFQECLSSIQSDNVRTALQQLKKKMSFLKDT